MTKKRYAHLGIEALVRPAESPDVLSRVVDERKPEPDDLSATITWGAESTFAFLRNSLEVKYTDPPSDPEEPGDTEVIYQEILRVVQPRRITNPLDAEDYVDVENVREIVFQGPSQTVRFIYAIY